MKSLNKITILLILIILVLEATLPVASFGASNENETIEENISLNETETDESENTGKTDNDNNQESTEATENESVEEQELILNEERNESKELVQSKKTIISNFEKIEEAEETETEEVETAENKFNNYTATGVKVVYMSHIKNEDWQDPVTDGEISGTTGQSKLLDAMKMKLINAPSGSKIKYKIYDEDGEWKKAVHDGENVGDIELSKKIYGIKIELDNMDAYSIQYKVHLEHKGWLDWKTDGSLAGDINGTNGIEAIQIRIISKVDKTINVKYKSYIEGVGWQQDVKNGSLSGTTGQGKKIQNITIELENSNFDSKISYQVYLAHKEWQEWKSDGENASSDEGGNRIEAIKIKLKNLNEYNITYRVHIQDIGWQAWKSNGAVAGTTGQSKRIEAIQIKLTKKTSNVTSNELSITYNSHIQNIGWEKDFSKSNGQSTGTTGKGLRIEALKIKLSNASEEASVKYSAYVEGEGWLDETSDGGIAGSTGKGLKLLGLKVNLENLDNYSVMYRIHVQDIGWKPWVKDGQETEEIEKKKRVEAIQIKLVLKKSVFAVTYSSHIQDIGWESDFSKNNGIISGTFGQSKRIEAIKFKLSGNKSGTGIRYRAYIENQGWQAWKSNGAIAGTTGKGLKLLGLKIELLNMDEYSIQYRVHLQDYGWSNWAVDGQTLGRISQNKRIEAIQARIIQKTVSYPQNVCYASKVQNIGWEEEWLHKNGEISGTTGKNLGIYGFKLKIENFEDDQQIEYRLHVQNSGWLSWTSKEYLSQADGKRLEAIQIRLKNMDAYTVEYRAHVQDIGWQEWMIDGETAGTTGKGKRIEAIQIRIVPKYKRRYVGVDVSEWNKSINWQSVRNAGVDFAIVRVGYGREANQKDSYFEANYAGAKAAGLKVGTYIYSYAKDIVGARLEAYNCLNWLGQRSLNYPVFYDLEDGNQSSLSAQTITDMAKAFYEIVSSAGYQVGVYANRNWLMNKIYTNQLSSNCQIWLAHYTYSESKPSDYPGTYQIWQYTSVGRISGISGNVDVNIGYRNY